MINTINAEPAANLATDSIDEELSEILGTTVINPIEYNQANKPYEPTDEDLIAMYESMVADYLDAYDWYWETWR